MILTSFVLFGSLWCSIDGDKPIKDEVEIERSLDSFDYPMDVTPKHRGVW